MNFWRQFQTFVPPSNCRVFGESRCSPQKFAHALNVLFRTVLPRKMVSSYSFLPNDIFTLTSLRFQFSGGSNVTLEGSQDPHWGWVNSHGQQVGEKLSIIDGCVLIEVYQWWDAMQTTASQVNRPDGWGFQSITNGEIRYMKLWQASVGMVQPTLQDDSTPVSLSP